MSVPAKVIASVDYSHIESLAQIRPPYPAQGTPEWWAMRKRVEELIAKESRQRGTQYTEAQYHRSEAARRTALGDEGDHKLAYERNGFTREQWLKKWNPTGKFGPGYIPTDFGR